MRILNNLRASIDLWSWLFPLTYLLHIAEEYWGGEGYPAYLLRLRGVYLSPSRFWLAQSIGVILVIAGIILSRRLKFYHMMLVILGAAVLVNGVTHTITSARHLSYGPGLLTSIFVWIPLGVSTLVRFKTNMSSQRYWLAVIIGTAINGAVAVITLRGGRLV